jgi:hypothetical protein
MVTVIRSCEATREARSGTRRMTALLSLLVGARSPSLKKARRIKGTVIRSCIATREARSGARRMTVHHFYLKRAFLRKRAQRIIVTVIRSCKTTRIARSGARRMTVHNGIPVSCLVLDQAMIRNST